MSYFNKIKKGQHSEFVAAGWLIKNNYLVYFKTQYKRHELQDDLRELKITRLGVGVGFYY